MSTEKTTAVRVRMYKDKWAEFRRICERKNLIMSNVVGDLVLKWIEENREKQESDKRR